MVDLLTYDLYVLSAGGADGLFCVSLPIAFSEVDKEKVAGIGVSEMGEDGVFILSGDHLNPSRQ